MIGDKRYTEALDPARLAGRMVEERCSGVEALVETGVELLQVRMQT
jgi:hypothetical protein